MGPCSRVSRMACLNYRPSPVHVGEGWCGGRGNPVETTPFWGKSPAQAGVQEYPFSFDTWRALILWFVTLKHATSTHNVMHSMRLLIFRSMYLCMYVWADIIYGISNYMHCIIVNGLQLRAFSSQLVRARGRDLQPILESLQSIYLFLLTQSTSNKMNHQPFIHHHVCCKSIRSSKSYFIHNQRLVDCHNQSIAT